MTPLVQFLKDKKANKGKEVAASQKGAKHSRQDSKDVKPSNVADNKSATGTTTVFSPKKRSAQAVKVEQAAREAVRVLNKQAASTSKGPASIPSPASGAGARPPTVPPGNTANAPLAEKKRERGSASAAAKILQRDLGLGGNTAGRGGRRGGFANTARAPIASTNTTTRQETVPQASNASTTTGSSATAPKTDTVIAGSDIAVKSTALQPPSGPAASLPGTKATHPASTNVTSSNSAASSPKRQPPPSTATQAFLKHANPSQGITEPLLEDAFATFGSINKVEIDKKKGFAYVDFKEPESLQKAIKASPIKVAQGQVVVLERKTGPNLQARNMRGGGAMMGGRGGSIAMGGRGGSMRSRGGFGRGGADMHNANSKNPLPATNAAAKQSPAVTRVPTAATESSAAPAATAPAPPAD